MQEMKIETLNVLYLIVIIIYANTEALCQNEIYEFLHSNIYFNFFSFILLLIYVKILILFNLFLIFIFLYVISIFAFKNLSCIDPQN